MTNTLSVGKTFRVYILKGNRELIRLYEEKVKKVIERVWEG